MPEISVIVPVYNVEKYIHRCVDSILNQTFTDFELILVDDGSPDNCGKICDEYAEKDNRIKVIHKKNGGLSSARNAGLDVANGKFVMFCDSDDYVNSMWCEIMHNAIQKFPNSCIVTDMNRVIDNSISPINIKRFTEDCSLRKCSYFEIYKMGLSGFSVNKIYNLNIIKNRKIRFDENCFFAEDVEFNVKYCQHVTDYYFIQKHLYYYIDNPIGIMNTYRTDLLTKNIFLYYVRLSLIGITDHTEYCNIWLYQFINLFDNIFDKRNTKMSLFKKFAYNNDMIKTKEFQFCVENSTENELLKKVLKLKNYYIFWIFQKITSFKQKLRSIKK